jgi:hypothetical protein
MIRVGHRCKESPDKATHASRARAGRSSQGASAGTPRVLPGREGLRGGVRLLAASRNSRLTTQWSGRPTAQAFWRFLAQCLWAAAHRRRSARVPPAWKGGAPATVVIGKIAFECPIHQPSVAKESVMQKNARPQLPSFLRCCRGNRCRGPACPARRSAHSVDMVAACHCDYRG